MSYSCTDFADTVLDALSIKVPDESADSPSDQADLVIEELERRERVADAMLAALRKADRRIVELCGIVCTLANHPKKVRAEDFAEEVRVAIALAEDS